MAVVIDVVYVDSGGHVVGILHRFRPWRLGPIVWRSRWVIELPAGTAEATGLQIGDAVELIDWNISDEARILQLGRDV
jgi:uncharacterized membrane protein (UPF0127 family)